MCGFQIESVTPQWLRKIFMANRLGPVPATNLEPVGAASRATAAETSANARAAASQSKQIVKPPTKQRHVVAIPIISKNHMHKRNVVRCCQKPMFLSLIVFEALWPSLASTSTACVTQPHLDRAINDGNATGHEEIQGIHQRPANGLNSQPIQYASWWLMDVCNTFHFTNNELTVFQYWFWCDRIIHVSNLSHHDLQSAIIDFLKVILRVYKWIILL